jgi:diadenosine tetraphosphate (Ap4A) HIT family hydrolase
VGNVWERVAAYLGIDGERRPATPPPSVEQLWAGWRIPYIEAGADARSLGLPRDLTLFEGIERSGRPDEETYIVWRGETCFALLNAYPYTSGHLMVLPKRGEPDLAGLSATEAAELWDGVRRAVIAVRGAFRCHGVNVGLNLGAASGAGIPDHLHVHVVPRWSADTNFMTTVANTRVLPESLEDSWRRLCAAWPD